MQKERHRCVWHSPLVVALALSVPSVSAAQSVDLAHVREAATRGFVIIQTTQKASRTKQMCGGTCHLQGMGALAYRSMKEHGLPVDEEVARADATKAFGSYPFSSVVEQRALSEPGMGAFSLVAAHTAGLRPSLTTAAAARALALQQQPAGDWTSVHVRIPSSYSSFTFTAWGLRALQLYSHATQKTDATARIARARTWLESHQPQATEERTFQLLGLLWAGAARPSLGRLGRALAATQQADGGWNSLDGRPSDAYSTGQALVALHDASGMPTSDRVWQRGLAFLLETQAVDGSWHVASRLPVTLPVSPEYYESGYPSGHDQFISVAGANWAVMALTRALGSMQAVDQLPLAAVEPAPLEPWVETVMFGSLADVTRLLDNGLNPNAATAQGGTTALMIAQPDVAKVKLLLDRGATINARSQQRGYSALMVAAQYRQGTAAIRLLLERGAEIGEPIGQRRPFADGSALFFAAHAGNVEVLPLLRQSGDAINDRSVLFGSLPVTPLSVTVMLDQIDACRVLIALGADIEKDGRGLTPLMQAVLGNRVEIARLLIGSGADVNRVDGRGMTPLLYAASINFGDSVIVDLLLKSGARTDARDKDGLTALELAEKYRHTHLIPSLRAEAPGTPK